MKPHFFPLGSVYYSFYSPVTVARQILRPVRAFEKLIQRFIESGHIPRHNAHGHARHAQQRNRRHVIVRENGINLRRQIVKLLEGYVRLRFGVHEILWWNGRGGGSATAHISSATAKRRPAHKSQGDDRVLRWRLGRWNTEVIAHCVIQTKRLLDLYDGATQIRRAYYYVTVAYVSRP
jgi:hypothetical protein